MTATATTDDLFAQPGPPPGKGGDGAYTFDGKPDQWKRYRLPHPTSGRAMGWTRATTFAKTIDDTYTLNMWGRRMSIKGLSMRPDLLAATASTPLDERDKLNKIAEDAAEHAGSKSAATLGTALHAFAEQVDAGLEPYIPAPWDADVRAYRAALEREGVTILPGLIERIVVVERYGVAGTFDRILGTEPCPTCGRTKAVGDLKSGRDLSYGWTEISIQLALYAHADRVWNKATLAYEPMPEVCRCRGIVMHLPVGQATCTFYEVDLVAGWEAAALCEAVRAWRKRRDLAVPRAVARVEQTPAGPVVEVDRPPTYAERIERARAVADLSAIWREADARGEWTAELETLGLARRAAIMADVAGG
jgi:hypothetical protein